MSETVNENSNIFDDSILTSEDLSDTNASIGVYATFLRLHMPNFEDRLLLWLKTRLIKSGKSTAYVNRLCSAHTDTARKCRLLKQFLSSKDLKNLEAKLAEEWGKIAAIDLSPVHLE